MSKIYTDMSKIWTDMCQMWTDMSKVLTNMFKILVYTNDIKIHSNITVLRAYRLKIPPIINPKFKGIAVKYKDNYHSQNNINFFLEKYKTLHINIYPLCKKNNIKFINDIYRKYQSRISVTSDYLFKY